MNQVSPSKRWSKFFGDLSSTKVQLIYGISGLTFVAIGKGIVLSKSVPDVVALLAAIVPLLLTILGTYLADRGKDAYKEIALAKNGAPPTTQP